RKEPGGVVRAAGRAGSGEDSAGVWKTAVELREPEPAGQPVGSLFKEAGSRPGESGGGVHGAQPGDGGGDAGHPEGWRSLSAARSCLSERTAGLHGARHGGAGGGHRGRSAGSLTGGDKEPDHLSGSRLGCDERGRLGEPQGEDGGREPGLSDIYVGLDGAGQGGNDHAPQRAGAVPLGTGGISGAGTGGGAGFNFDLL